MFFYHILLVPLSQQKKTVTKVLSQPLILNKWCSRDSLSAIRHDFVKYGKLFSTSLLIALVVTRRNFFC
ncbi:hypothetical protein DQM25_02625 [Enterococcus faecium]|uniref:Uncharacterized protein n=1 Tax=Enterococcus faecium TaxID=1352 RepID=A0AAI8LL10_ENTFC|nr:hypothetical protein D9Z05_08430 [Enterococcus faecium]PHL16714.1 hypothetical protein CQR38_00610 [Enterococcus faecium]RDG10218.1 hypothetical protein DQM25_02625 [Enterococcus faecium]RRG16413.1 hypothetical protein CQ403_04865 [Enterococcus faecium]